MLIDWFTVGAQTINFLVLVWLMGRYLYQPILNAIDAREKRIELALSDAAMKQTAAQKERDEFQQKNQDFEQQRNSLLNQARERAESERHRLLDEARQVAENLRTQRMEALTAELDSLQQDIARRCRREVFAIAEKVLRELADMTLEQRMAEMFVRHLRSLDTAAKAELTQALKGANHVFLVRSAFDFAATQREEILQALQEVLGTGTDIQFSTTPDLISGIELTANGWRLAWRVADFLAQMDQRVEGLVKEPNGSPEPSHNGNAYRMSISPNTLHRVIEVTFDAMCEGRESCTARLTAEEVGTISRVSTGIAMVNGLPGVGFDELLHFPGDVFGIAFNVDELEIGVVLLGDFWQLQAGDSVKRTGRVMDVAVGHALLGRVIDPLGRPLDAAGPVATRTRLAIERPAAHIMERAPVTVPLQTGLKVVDALIPVGRGQRELILGDRQTGKTTLAIDTILNQKGKDVVCVYCAIGQRASAVAKSIAILRDKGAMAYSVVVVTEGNEPPGLAYIAPYAATSVAEYFMEAGRDVLIVYDDLTHHARAYRELSLLLRRPPGREAFPGDIFYLHSRLLERATHLCPERGGGSLTALPIIETEAQNISAYIPTNLISITDGQIYLSPSLFALGVLPAVDVGKSVSRVGGKAQRAAYRAVAADLKLAYAQFEELETFARFGARLDEKTTNIIEHGRRIRACLKQPESAPVCVAAQIMILLALESALFENVPLPSMRAAEEAVRLAASAIPEELSARLETAPKLSEPDRAAIIEIARTALASFQRMESTEQQPMAQSSQYTSHSSGCMSDSTLSLRRKIDTAADLQSVVRTMKAVAASSITQYDRAVEALDDYYRTVQLGLTTCLRHSPWPPMVPSPWRKSGAVAALVFGSDQGLVGRFNDVMVEFVRATLIGMPGQKTVLSVGERIQTRLALTPLQHGRSFVLPGSIQAVTNLVGQVLIEVETLLERGEIKQVYVFHNSPHAGTIYTPVCQRLLPLDETWQWEQQDIPWPTKMQPQVVGAADEALRVYIREYLFVSLYRACAQSLASENASRLAAMQRAEKNIDELMENLNRSFHRLRQSGIDEELFDVISGFEALSPSHEPEH